MGVAIAVATLNEGRVAGEGARHPVTRGLASPAGPTPSSLCDLDSLSFLICTVTGALPTPKDWMRGDRDVSCEAESWSIMH